MKIIAGIKYLNSVKWIWTEQDVWLLNLTQIDVTLVPDSALEIRKGFPLLSTDTIASFLDKMSDCVVSTEFLKNNLRASKENLYPSLYVDFDGKIFYDNFPEPNNFFLALPNDWTYSYDNLDDVVHTREQYWRDY